MRLSHHNRNYGTKREDSIMNPVKLGLIGLGEWPRQAYVPVLKELDTVRVCAVAAQSSATQEYAREQFGSQTAVYDDYRDLCWSSELWVDTCRHELRSKSEGNGGKRRVLRRQRSHGRDPSLPPRCWGQRACGSELSAPAYCARRPHRCRQTPAANLRRCSRPT